VSIVIDYTPGHHVRVGKIRVCQYMSNAC